VPIDSKAYLLIDLGEEHPPADRYLVASTVLETIMEFWTRFFSAQQISDDAEQP
jgi:hypothetical protein